jgi:hypothetical protein
MFHLADLYAQESLSRVAHSALPDAPVQPHVEPTMRTRKFVAALRRPLRRPILGSPAVSTATQRYAP